MIIKVEFDVEGYKNTLSVTFKGKIVDENSRKRDKFWINKATELFLSKNPDAKIKNANVEKIS
jgi:hypothetical protein